MLIMVSPSKSSMRSIFISCLVLLSGLIGQAQAKNAKIRIPEETFSVVECSWDDNPAIIVVNTSLRKFKAKKYFGWSCSLCLEFKDCGENGIPTIEESDFVYNYFMQLDSAIRGDQNHPNALLLARITYHGSYEIIWQINNPDIVHEYLQNIINEKSYPREMDYRIEYDEKWKNVNWYLQDFSKKKKR